MVRKQNRYVTTHLVGLMIVCAAMLACKQDTKVYVECKGVGLGYSCEVTHQQGRQAANACWTVRVQCQNGGVYTANGCQSVQPGAKASRFIPIADFHAEQCDQASGVSVENIKVTVQ